MAKGEAHRQIPAIRVNQWLKIWDQVKFDSKHSRAKPEPHFYIFSIPATELRSLCGIFRRESKGVKPRAADLGIQRQHDEDRSDEISRFVRHGYPWSTLSAAKQAKPEYHDLRKPGWLPTSIVINILTGKDKREGKQVAPKDLIRINNNSGIPHLTLPYQEWSAEWEPSDVPPLEVIDGQHRLWAFNADDDVTSKYEVPVVAFYGLDISWQAYLFWTINIKPKRINGSLAFDLYPLLRGEDWLERAEEHIVYRDTRSQELTEALWSHAESPWYDRINMLGETKNPWVSQAAWIRSLSSSFVKAWDARGSKRAGGLFGARIGEEGEVLSWSRAQQSAFLIYAWKEIRDAIFKSSDEWAVHLRNGVKRPPSADRDLAFYSPHSLLVTDQGVRGYLQVVNDVCYFMAPKLKLNTWTIKNKGAAATDEDAIAVALRSLGDHPCAHALTAIGKGLASFDWRTSSAPGLGESDKRQKLVFRGSGGYRELRYQLLRHLEATQHEVGKAAQSLLAPKQD